MANAAPLRGTSLLYSLTAQAKQYPDAIIMGRGDPDFDTPSNIVSAAGAAMQARANDYSPPEGLLELRKAIAARMK
jgi:aspartate aminotransferase